MPLQSRPPAAKAYRNGADGLVIVGQTHLHLVLASVEAEIGFDLRSAADPWFQRAQIASAMCRGLPKGHTFVPNKIFPGQGKFRNPLRMP